MAISDCTNRTSACGVSVFNISENFSANLSVFIYKLEKRLREELTKVQLPVYGDENEEFEEFIEGFFEIGRNDCKLAMPQVCLAERTGNEFVTVLKYSINLILAAALKGEMDWIRGYSEKNGNSNIFDYARNGALYGVCRSDNYICMIDALWARILWLEPDGEMAEKIWSFIEEQYENAGGQQEKLIILDFIENTIANVFCFDQKVNAGLMFKQKYPKIYSDWLKKDGLMENLPFSMILEHEIAEYEKEGDFATPNCVKKSVESLIGMENQDGENSNWNMKTSSQMLMGDFEWDDITDKWYGELCPDDGYVKQMRMRNSIKKRREFNDRRLKFFEDQVKVMGSLITPIHYFTVLNWMWRDIRNICMGQYNSILDGNSDNVCHGKLLADKYISIIKNEIKMLDRKNSGERGNKGYFDIKSLYVKHFLEVDIDQFMFYSNELQEKGGLVLGISALKKLGIPKAITEDICVDVFNPVNDIDEKNKRNSDIIQMWKKSKIQVKREDKIYEYQKNLICNCSEETLIIAAKCGIFPDSIRGLLVNYAVSASLWDKVPALIWIERGDKYAGRSGV